MGVQQKPDTLLPLFIFPDTTSLKSSVTPLEVPQWAVTCSDAVRNTTEAKIILLFTYL